MQNINWELIKVRLISFGYQAGGLIVIAVAGAVMSPEFRDVVASNLGTGIFGTIGLLAFDALVKHIRNVLVLKGAADDLGSVAHARATVTLI